MKKVLSYAVAAILLGTVTMLVPVKMLESICYDALTYGNGEVVPSRWCCPAEASEASNIPSEQGTLDGGEIHRFTLETSPLSKILYAGFMLVPSFLVALGVFIYTKKRVF
jgi:hypothetical protein